MSNNKLEHVFEEKDLGITIDSELKFREHISRKVRIANGIVGQIRRSFSFLDCETFTIEVKNLSLSCSLSSPVQITKGV